MHLKGAAFTPLHPETPVVRRGVTGFTLLELLVVIIILGILASVGFAGYGRFRENTLNREAEANLRLIVAAERVYRLEVNGFVALADTDHINTALRLRIPSGAGRNWDYTTTAPTADTSCAQATRSVAVSDPNYRSLHMGHNDTGPTAGTCP
jgi:prepilin-type N-terminal cleavage/methylation domain-containing protein